MNSSTDVDTMDTSLVVSSGSLLRDRPHLYRILDPPDSCHSCGSVFLFRPRYTLLNSRTDGKGRFVLADFQHRSVTFRVACLYAPNHNPDRDHFFVFCSSKIDPSIPTLVCGDFNTVPDQSLDRHGSNILDTSRESTATLLSFMTVELWTSTTAFSWLRLDGTLSSRIDLIGCPYAWIHLVQSCDLLACLFSDLAFPVPEPLPRGPVR